MQTTVGQRVRAEGRAHASPGFRCPCAKTRQAGANSFRRWSGGLVPVFVLVALALCWPGWALASPTDRDDEASVVYLPRLRTFDLRLAQVIRKGYDASQTFRELVKTIERSDVIVHVERHNRFGFREAGRLRIAGGAGGQRYLQISLSTTLNDRELLVFMAHEMQHAVEVAQSDDVVDAHTLGQYYCQIGTRRTFGFDTDAAQRVTRIVGDELARSSKR